MAYTHTKRIELICAGSALALLLAVATPAMAGFELKAPQAVPPKVTEEALPPAAGGPTSLLPGAVPAPAKPDLVEGAGTNVPLRVAVMRIVPADKMVVFGDGVDAAQPVTWSGGKVWPDLLGDLAAATNLSLDISAKTVTLARPASSVSVAAAKAESAKAVPEATVWEGQEGEFLQAVLRRWCEQQSAASGKKVRLDWEATSDFKLKAAAHIPASFEIAARTLLAGFKDAPGKPAGLLKNNPVGDSVLIVKSRSKNYYGG